MEALHAMPLHLVMLALSVHFHIRVHRSFMVAINKIDYIERTGALLPVNISQSVKHMPADSINCLMDFIKPVDFKRFISTELQRNRVILRAYLPMH